MQVCDEVVFGVAENSIQRPGCSQIRSDQRGTDFNALHTEWCNHAYISAATLSSPHWAKCHYYVMLKSKIVINCMDTSGSQRNHDATPYCAYLLVQMT